MQVIRCEGLTRTFGSKLAVSALDLTVQTGEVFGFLGPNGAGKTTTIRMLAGLLMPTSGTACVLGSDVRAESDRIRQRIGVLTETPALYNGLTGRQNLAFYAELYRLDPRQAGARVDELLEAFQLTVAADRAVGGYSKGMRQRLAIARAILHDPELIFFDEPTSGLDPAASLGVRQMIQTLSQQSGRTIFLCTHNLDKAQRLCHRIGVIHDGVLRAVGRPVELAERFWEGLWLEIDLGEPPTRAIAVMLAHLGVDGWEATEKGMRLRLASRKEIPKIVQALVEGGASVYRVAPKEWSLADIYFRIQQESVPEGDQGGKA